MEVVQTPTSCGLVTHRHAFRWEAACGMPFDLSFPLAAGVRFHHREGPIQRPSRAGSDSRVAGFTGLSAYMAPVGHLCVLGRFPSR
jgi:hypothetical protein